MPARSGSRWPEAWDRRRRTPSPVLAVPPEARAAFAALATALRGLGGPTPCQVGETALWHPSSDGRAAGAVAAARCRTCPVVAECLAAGLAGHESGVWGATTAADRDAMRREARARVTRERRAAVRAGRDREQQAVTR
ncbi:hypothetical protein GCU67_08120 [Modestobacter muralis]|uniref:4Fe-4S Wbl-type domain-containing protein n=1 Tax=Modestobacter muralis TaxID=1608614 RepID=A0A6P0ETD9_9ACTN|nr:hypothetical protein [Modestobacter muralis]NEN50907.1 hypothetical protein [Modestobacter muralis]